MLKIIRCDKLSRNTLIFSNGLNAILGPRSGENSIGKSSVLYLIDFAFSGDDFITYCKDVIDEVGEVIINFTYEFNGVTSDFRRSTLNPGIVIFIDGNEEKEKTIEDFRGFLFKSYGFLNDGPTFRNLSSRFIRIWKKGNDNPDHPLNVVAAESYNQIKDFLIKSFGYQAIVSEIEALRKEQENKKSHLEAAFKEGFITKINKTQYNDMKNKLNIIMEHLSSVKKNLGLYVANINMIINENNLKITQDKDYLLKQKSEMDNRILRLSVNLENKSPAKEKYFDRLKEFIPNVNIEKVREVEGFHSSISKILRKQIQDEKNVLESQLFDINHSLVLLDRKIKQMIDVIDTPSELVDEVLKLTLEKNEIEKSLSFKEMSDELTKNLKELKEEVKGKVEVVLEKIAICINNSVKNYTYLFYPANRVVPKINLELSNYKFEHYTDTGTGKSYADLVALDLSFLEITTLPLIIEDSVIFKNIESPTNDKIINILSQNKKQIFIAMDQLSLLSSDSRKILRAARFMRVSRRIPAFKRLWNVKN